MANESAWCIERGPVSAPLYLSVENECFVWTPDHMKALRLSRREDADMLSEIVLDEAQRIAEHAWERGAR